MLLDHLAVSGATLAQATAYVEDALGVSMQAGGEHAVFHTHNTLLGLEDGLYLEAIAINPDAPTPDCARWFNLDQFSGAARLTNWICRTEDLAQDLEHLPVGIGAPVALQRGDLRWDMVVPDSGLLPYDNLCPALIRWNTPNHPATRLAPSGCTLKRLIVTHPQADALRSDLAKTFLDARIVFENGTCGLRAEIETPHGIRLL
jgi:hypothetical protein